MPKKISKIRLERLAKDTVDAWDLDTLIEYAIAKMTKSLSTLNTKDFKKEWDDYYGEFIK